MKGDVPSQLLAHWQDNLFPRVFYESSPLLSISDYYCVVDVVTQCGQILFEIDSIFSHVAFLKIRFLRSLKDKIWNNWLFFNILVIFQLILNALQFKNQQNVQLFWWFYCSKNSFLKKSLLGSAGNWFFWTHFWIPYVILVLKT